MVDKNDDYVTKSDLAALSTDLRKEMRAGFDEMTEIMQGFMQQVADEFGRVHNRIDDIEGEIVDLRKSHDTLLNTIDTFIGRIDRYESEQVARDAQFEKLLSWAKKVSKQTGIPLEGF
jgi:septal ring factor EnvC (AmiA/AmiB activator)